MSFFAELGNKISESSKKVVKGVNDFAETTKLKDQITAEGKTQAEFFSQLGQLVFNTEPEQCRSEPFSGLTQEIIASKEKVEQLRQQIEEIQAANGKICPECGERSSGEAKFCANCGSELLQPEPEPPAKEKTCAACGGVVGENDAFCMSCGAKIQDEAEVQIAAESEDETVTIE